MKTAALLLTALAALATAKTDFSGCTSSQTVAYGGASLIWYVPDTGEICELLDCGGGRAPPKTTVPGCPQYSGTATYSPSYLPNWGQATASASMSMSGSSSGSASPKSSPASSPVVTKSTSMSSQTTPAPVVTSTGTAPVTLSTSKAAGNATISTKSATPTATAFPGAAADVPAKSVMGLILGAAAAAVVALF